VARIGCVVLAVFAAAFACLVFYDDSMSGFPDGHRTELDRFMRAPNRGVAAASLAVGVFALWIATFGHRSRLVLKLAAVVVALHVLVALWLFAPGIAGSVLGLDSGQGG
jgi:hypothetical protein